MCCASDGALCQEHYHLQIVCYARHSAEQSHYGKGDCSRHRAGLQEAHIFNVVNNLSSLCPKQTCNAIIAVQIQVQLHMHVGA